MYVFPATPGTRPDETANWMLMASDAKLSITDPVEVKPGKNDPVLTDAGLSSAVLDAYA